MRQNGLKYVDNFNFRVMEFMAIIEILNLVMSRNYSQYLIHIFSARIRLVSSWKTGCRVTKFVLC
jgi:hypothetical protein